MNYLRYSCVAAAVGVELTGRRAVVANAGQTTHDEPWRRGAALSGRNTSQAQLPSGTEIAAGHGMRLDPEQHNEPDQWTEAGRSSPFYEQAAAAAVGVELTGRRAVVANAGQTTHDELWPRRATSIWHFSGLVQMLLCGCLAFVLSLVSA